MTALKEFSHANENNCKYAETTTKLTYTNLSSSNTVDIEVLLKFR